MSADVLTRIDVEQLLLQWRPGSHDWSWLAETRDLFTRHADVTFAIERRVLAEGIGFDDHLAPILLGHDGRVWDGHHRIVIAATTGIESVMVEHAPSKATS